MPAVEAMTLPYPYPRVFRPAEAKSSAAESYSWLPENMGARHIIIDHEVRKKPFRWQ